MKHATFRLSGRTLMCIDTPVTQPFTCASTVSLTVVGDTEAGLDELFAHLSDGGTA